MEVYCLFSVELPHRGDSNEHTQYTIYNIKKKITINYPKSATMGFCSKGPKKEFETPKVNGPSVFEPLKFYCIIKSVCSTSLYHAYISDNINIYKISKRISSLVEKSDM